MKQRLEYEVVVKDALITQRSGLLSILAGGRRVGKALNVELANVEKRIADLFFEIGDRGLLHIDVQSWNFARMPYRMCIYGVSGVWQYGKDELESVVLYIGKARLRMKDSFDIGAYQGRCRIVDIREIAAEVLLQSPYPGDHMMAMLARGGVERLREIVRKIARLKGVRRQKALAQLMVLSGLRGIVEELKMEFKEAGLLVNIEKNVMLKEIRDAGYKKGREEGLAEGEARGEARGQAKGMAAGQRQVLQVLMVSKFGKLPAWAAEKLDRATQKQIERWSVNLLSAPTLERVLRSR